MLHLSADYNSAISCKDNGNINNLRLLKSETWLVDRLNNETKNETKPLINLITIKPPLLKSWKSTVHIQYMGRTRAKPYTSKLNSGLI